MTSSAPILVTASIVGTAPVLFHNVALANPLGDYAKRIKALTSKRKKTDEDHAEIARLEWEGGLYLDPAGRPSVPGSNLDAVIIDGAKRSKRGKLFQSAVFVSDEDVPLIYEGPTDLGKMWSDGRFSDIRGVSVGQATVMRSRPIFRKWALEFTISILPGAGVNVDDVREALELGGIFSGLGDFRPRYGRFAVERFN